MQTFSGVSFLFLWCSLAFLIGKSDAQSTEDGAKGIQFGNAAKIFRHKTATPSSKPEVHDSKPPTEKPEEQVGVKYQIKLTRDGQSKMVPSTFQFIEGDVIHLMCDLNEDSYVYILQRTLFGGSIGDKGVTAAPTPYKLLYPLGDAHKLSAGKDQVIPDDVVLTLDNEPGIEKLYVLISKKPLDVAGLANSQRDKTAELTHLLASSRTNTQATDFGSEAKGVNATKEKSVQPINYALSEDPEKPFVAIVTLQHFARTM